MSNRGRGGGGGGGRGRVNPSPSYPTGGRGGGDGGRGGRGYGGPGGRGRGGCGGFQGPAPDILTPEIWKAAAAARTISSQELQEKLALSSKSSAPEVASKRVCKMILDELEKCYRKSNLGNRTLAYDGKKSIYTAGPLPFQSKDFIVKLEDDKDGAKRRDREFKVSIKIAARLNFHLLQEFIQGKQSDAPQEVIQMLDVIMRAAAPKK